MKQESPNLIEEVPDDLTAPEGMVWIPGGRFMQGAVKNNKLAIDHEKPAHPVAIDGFLWIRVKKPSRNTKNL